MLIDLEPAARRLADLAGVPDGLLDAPTPCPEYRLGDLLDHVGGLALAEAWHEPAAWEGMTRVGGLDLPGEVAGVVALDELVIHAWDVARASGQPYDCDPASLNVVHEFVSRFSGPGKEDQRRGLFGPEVDVSDQAPLLDRVIGMAGREPGWSSTA